MKLTHAEQLEAERESDAATLLEKLGRHANGHMRTAHLSEREQAALFVLVSRSLATCIYVPGASYVILTRAGRDLAATLQPATNFAQPRRRP